MSSPSTISVVLIVFYLVLALFATSDLRRFIFHVHISRVDRAPVQVDIDSSSSLWYPILVGIIFNIFIIIFSIVNLFILLWERNVPRQLSFSTFILLLIFTIRFIINLMVTKNRNGLATPTLVERSFLAPSLSLEEEFTTITIDWFIKMIGLISTLLFSYPKHQEQTMRSEQRRETQLLSDFE
jgi:hypothetical protein